MRRVLAAAAATSVALAGVLALAGPSAAQDDATVTVGGLEPRGEVVLRTGWSNASVSYTDADGTVTPTGSFAAGCASPVVDLGALVISGASGTTCFGTAGFGDGSGRNGAPFYLNPNVKGTESLTVGLAGPAAELEITDVSLDIEARSVSGPDLTVQPRLDGQPVGDAEAIDLDDVRVQGIALPNYRVDLALDVPADEIVLTPIGEVAFQLEGDTNSTGSIFTLTDVTDVVPCAGEAIESNGATLTAGGEGCTDQPVFFEFVDNEVTLLKDPSDAELTLVVPWVDDSTTAAYPGRTTQIDYLDGVDSDEDGDTFDPMVFCDVTDGIALPSDQIPVTPDVDGWCVADRDIPLDNGDGSSTTRETLYGVGDPRFK